MSGEHTKGPWKQGQYASDAHIQPYVRLWGPDGGLLGDLLVERNGRANARRIVACVNACEGLSTEWLENKYFDFIGGDEIEVYTRND